MNLEKKIRLALILLVGSIGLYSFEKSDTPEPELNISAYLKQADGTKIYPSAKQIEMLKAVLPKEAFQAAPKINDRVYWGKISASGSGKLYLTKALSLLPKKPEVPISDEIYRRANKEGNRGIYKPRYYRTMECLEHFILAECIENEGRFLPQIHVFSKAILNMKSWVHPNHDDRDNGVLEGKRVTIDLGARRFGSVLALAENLLGNKLDENLRTEITKQLQTRIIDSYLTSCEFLDENNKWIKSTSNWNSVCTSGSVFVAISSSKKEEERLAAIGSALNSMKYYLSGFGQDGYCSEGVGYWRYGFGHYLYLAQILKDYTNGKINLFEAHNPEKLKNVANFPENFHIQNNLYAPFADGSSVVKNNEGNFAYVLAAKQYGVRKPNENILDQAVEQLIVWKNIADFSTRATSELKRVVTPSYSYFDAFGMVISRGQQKTPFSIAMKAGHNSENHNHSDVGTYVVVLGEEIITGDIGAPSYRAGAFSPANKARSSWGHPVPRINNILQSNGRQFEGKITSALFEEAKDFVQMELNSAYVLPELKSLTRSIVNEKSDKGKITIKDSFESISPVIFGTAIMTFSKYEMLDANSLMITGEHQKLKVEIQSTGGKIVIHPEPVPVTHLREGKAATRIGVDFENRIEKGTISIIYTPVL
ncbi:hypothetical protein [Flavicella sediminum]|uniref:hypothetical protein n=1 Tax=Flavicella sediminum TaxID=2585141 RepID=UPI001122A10C|nr:hypothetical protein [Flavicella sediminum]